MPPSSGSAAISAPSRRAPFEWDYIVLFLLLALEFIVFDRLTAKYIAHFYPPWHDQIQYLSEVYNAFEAAKAHGFIAGLSYAVTKPSAQGMLGCPLTFCLFEIFGPSRSAALAVNILFVIAFQTSLFFASRRVLGSRVLAWSSFALTLCWHTVTAGGAGSASDFRLDLMAACAFGISLAVLLGTNGLRDRRNAIYFGLSVGAAILVRFLTATYFVFIFVALLFWLIRQTDAKRRVSNLLLAAAVATLIVFPIFWINRQWIWDYYVIGHYFGPESSIRKSHLNIIGSLRYISDMAFDHAGPWIFILAVPVVGTTYLSAQTQKDGVLPEKSTAPWMIPTTIYLLSPLLILSVHQQKSPIVESILVPSMIFFIVGLAKVFPGSRQSIPRFARGLANVTAAALVAAGFIHFTKREQSLAPSAASIAEGRKINAVVEYIYQQSQKHNLTFPKIGADKISDSLDAQIFRVICYEHHKNWQNFQMTLPTGIATAPEDLLMRQVQASDFLFLAVKEDAEYFPYDAEMRALRAKHRAWCQANLDFVEQFESCGCTWEFYQRRFEPKKLTDQLAQATPPSAP